MPERCPLVEKSSEMVGLPVDLPEVCLTQCHELMSDASNGAGEWDDYLRGKPIPDGEVVFSHDSVCLSSLQNISKRAYTIVDQVVTDDYDLEIGETTYTFECPHSSV